MATKVKKSKAHSIGNGSFARLIAILIVVCFIAGLEFTAHANYIAPYDLKVNRYVYENWGVAFIVAEGIFAFVLNRLQKGIYWFTWLQMKQHMLDERQRQVRQQVFERAYLFSILILIGSIQYASTPVQYAVQENGLFDLVSRLFWASTILVIALPSVLAAWRKDS